MKQLLFLTHRIPYPPNKGDKIRSFHVLRHLAQNYNVHLGAFIDDESDWQYESAVRQLCDQVKLVRLSRHRTGLKAIAGLLTGRPLTNSCYYNSNMAHWVEELVQARAIDRVLVFSSSMAQYAIAIDNVIRVIDFVDIDSDKWRQYADNKAWPISWLYRREARLLLAWERRIASLFNASLYVSTAEAQMFRQLAPESASRINYFNNGVDATYFSPSESSINPYPDGVQPIVFTGVMNYWPNVDAVTWFAEKVFPAIRAAEPRAAFYIVGANPAREVKALSKMPGVHVTHAVPDVRPWLAHASVCVAPLRIARGVQNKVLEAMSMAKVVVTSPEALEGIEASDGVEVLVAGDPEVFVQAVLSVLKQGRQNIGSAARGRILSQYGWTENLARLDSALTGENPRPDSSGPIMHTPVVHGRITSI